MGTHGENGKKVYLLRGSEVRFRKSSLGDNDGDEDLYREFGLLTKAYIFRGRRRIAGPEPPVAGKGVIPNRKIGLIVNDDRCRGSRRVIDRGEPVTRLQDPW